MKNLDYAKISSDNVRLLLHKNKLSVRKLAEEISIAPTTLNDSLKSKKGISIDSLIKIADYFNLTVNDLCNPSLITQNSSYTDESSLAIHKYFHLDSHGQELVSLVINEELERIRNEG